MEGQYQAARATTIFASFIAGVIVFLYCVLDSQPVTRNVIFGSGTYQTTEWVFNVDKLWWSLLLAIVMFFAYQVIGFFLSACLAQFYEFAHFEEISRDTSIYLSAAWPVVFVPGMAWFISVIFFNSIWSEREKTAPVDDQSSRPRSKPSTRPA